MSIPLTINGVTFQYPQQFDKNWAPTLTTWSQAVTNGMLQKAGGTFTLTAEVDFGSSFGLKTLSIKSSSANIAATGFLRLANASAGIVWRNAANSADLALTVNASNQLTFNGTSIGVTTSLTNSHILVGNVSNQPADVAMSGDATVANTGALTIANSAITNAKVSSSAAIALSKLAPATAYSWFIADASGVLSPSTVFHNKAVITDANGVPTASTTSDTELGFVNGVTSPVQTQLNARLQLAGGTMSGVLNMGSNAITAATAASATGQPVTYQQTGGAVTGSTANSGGTQGTLLQGTVSSPDLRANAVTVSSTSNSLSGSSGTSITSVSVTTIGGKVLVTASATISGASGTILSKARGFTTMSLTRDGVQIATSNCGLGMDNTANTFIYQHPLAITILDSPSAGAHTYATTYSTTASGSIFDYNLTAVEFRA